MMNNYKIALGWTLLHAFFFATSGIFIKKLAPDIDIFGQIFYRSAFTFLAIIAIYRPKISDCFNRRALPSLLSRSIFGMISMSCVYYSTAELPLAIAMALTLTTPIFVMILGHFSIGEKISLYQVAPAFLTLIGIALILDLKFGDSLEIGIPLVPALAGVLGSFLAALAFLSIRSALQLVGAEVVVFWFSLVGLIGTGIYTIGTLSLPTEDIIYFLIAVCVLGMLSDLTKTTAYKHAVAWFVSLASLSSIGFSVFWGWSIFDEQISPIQGSGIAIMLVGITLTIMKSRPKTAV